jgi:hypothetical protein
VQIGPLSGPIPTFFGVGRCRIRVNLGGPGGSVGLRWTAMILR